jgi:hypothetical protein
MIEEDLLAHGQLAVGLGNWGLHQWTFLAATSFLPPERLA